MAQEALGFMQNSKGKNLDFIEILSKEPDNILSLDVSSVKTLQIGYQAETLLLHKADDDTLTIKEYINGLSGSEYYAKVTANRFKTTIRYGRRETVNPATCIEIFLPDSFNDTAVPQLLFSVICQQIAPIFSVFLGCGSCVTDNDVTFFRNDQAVSCASI